MIHSDSFYFTYFISDIKTCYFTNTYKQSQTYRLSIEFFLENKQTEFNVLFEYYIVVDISFIDSNAFVCNFAIRNENCSSHS